VNELITVKNVCWSLCSDQSVSIGLAGDQVSLGIRHPSDIAILQVGQYLCDPQQPIPIVSRFQAKIIMMNYKIALLTGSQLLCCFICIQINKKWVLRKLYH